MAQFARPDSDVSSTNFTGFPATSPGSIYTNIDESSANDSDYVLTITTSASYECGLSDVTDPGIHTGHTFRWRVALSGPLSPGDDPIDYTVALYQGATLIASSSGSIGVATVTAVSKTLSSGEAGSITDYTDLRLRFTVPGASSPSVRFHWAELEVPDAPSDITVTPPPAVATAIANDATIDPGAVSVTPAPAYALAYVGDGVFETPPGFISVTPEPAVALAFVGEGLLDTVPTSVYPEPAIAFAFAPTPSASAPTSVTPTPAASYAGAGAVSVSPDGPTQVTPPPAVAQAFVTEKEGAIETDPPLPKRKMAGCRCTCRLNLISVLVTIRGCCSLCLGGARVQLLAGGVVVDEQIVPYGSSGCTVILGTTSLATPYEVRVSADGFVTQTVPVSVSANAGAATVTLLPTSGNVCFGPCGNTVVPASGGSKTLFDAKGNAIGMTQLVPGVYTGLHTYHVDDSFLDPCAMVANLLGTMMPAYYYGICQFSGAPPIKDIIGPGSVPVTYSVNYSSCGPITLGASWPMWACSCANQTKPVGFYCPPGPCANYCGDGQWVCPPFSLGRGGSYSSGFFNAASSSFDCETGEAFFDVPTGIPGCLIPGVGYDNSGYAHLNLGGAGIYSLL